MKRKLAMLLSLSTTATFFMQPSFAQEKGTPAYVEKVKITLASIAAEQDKSPSNNWLPTGKRDLRTAYRATPNIEKANFALDLQAFVNNAGEKLDDLSGTYVAYSKRKAFSESWWTKHSNVYAKLSAPEREKWIDESILDATQLRWQGLKRLNASYSASHVMAHDGLMVQLFKKQDKY
jgi:hypothetical protein